MPQLPALRVNSTSLEQLNRRKTVQRAKPSPSKPSALGSGRGTKRVVSRSVETMGASPPAGYKTSHYRREEIVRNSVDDRVTHGGTVTQQHIYTAPTAGSLAKSTAAVVGSAVGTNMALKAGAKIGGRLLRNVPIVGPLVRGASMGATAVRLAKAAKAGQKISKAAAVRALITSGL